MNTNKLRDAKSIDEFLEVYNKVLANGDFEAVCEAVAENLESDKLRWIANMEPFTAPDEALLRVVREVWKSTEGKRDIADLVGADKSSLCRLCKWGDFGGVVCTNEHRRAEDLADGQDEEFCACGRKPLFFGGRCRFFGLRKPGEDE